MCLSRGKAFLGRKQEALCRVIVDPSNKRKKYGKFFPGRNIFSLKINSNVRKKRLLKVGHPHVSPEAHPYSLSQSTQDLGRSLGAFSPCSGRTVVSQLRAILSGHLCSFSRFPHTCVCVHGGRRGRLGEVGLICNSQLSVCFCVLKKCSTSLPSLLAPLFSSP